MQFDWDINQRSGVEEGRRYEPMIALGFGWNVLDWMAPELFLRYSSNRNLGRREHIAGANIGVAFTWAPKPLIDFKKWRILPFIMPETCFQVVVLPGDPNANDDRISSKGVGGGIRGGIRFLFKEYLYFGFEAEEEFLYHEGQTQMLRQGGTAQIYKGGWKPQFSVFTIVGIHY